MLKRQRPVTPPPSSLGDPPPFLLDAPIRPYLIDPSQPYSKRQRVRPPPLDGTLRGWLGMEPESDGEEDWVEDARDVLPPSGTADQYKDANNLLHELHVLNQHRLLFVRDRHLNPTLHTYIQDPSPGDRSAAWTDTSPCHSPPSQLGFDGVASRSRCIGSEKSGLIEEVQCVRQHYEDANRLLGSLFLSRRRDVERTAPLDPHPNS